MTNERNPVMWFEIPVSDLARAKKFYSHVFNIELEEQQIGDMHMAFFPMHKDTSGAAGSLIRSQGYTPSESGILIYFTTSDIEAALARAEELGGKTLTAKTSIGEYGFIGTLRDSEGNRIGLHSTT